MTNREFLTAVSTSNVSDEIKEYATNAIAKMDAANAKKKENAKNKPSKTALENAPYLDKIETEMLGADPITSADVAEALGVSVPKASALLRGLVNEGRAVSSDIKVDGKTRKGYTTPIGE